LTYAGLVIVFGGIVLLITFRQLLKTAGVRPPAPGPLSERWLFEQRRHHDEQ